MDTNIRKTPLIYPIYIEELYHFCTNVQEEQNSKNHLLIIQVWFRGYQELIQ
jgi:hypothetical protein